MTAKSHGYDAWFSRLVRRDLRRAASFLWITPFDAAQSILEMATCSNSSAFSISLAAKACSYRLIAVR